MSAMKLRPIGNDVIIHPIDNPQMSEGGIHLPEREKRDVINQGFIIAKGPAVREELEIADHVLFNGYTGDKVSLRSGGIFFVIPEDFIVAVMTGSGVVLLDTKMMKRIILERFGELHLMNEGNPDESVGLFLDSVQMDLIERIDAITMAEGFEF